MKALFSNWNKLWATFPGLMCCSSTSSDLWNHISQRCLTLCQQLKLDGGAWTVVLPSLVLIIFGSSPLPDKKWNSFGMSFFEKKTERIHRGSPPTDLRSGHKRLHSHARIFKKNKNTHTHTAQGMLGNIRHPGRKEDRLFPHLLHGYFRCQAKNSPMLTKATLNQLQAVSSDGYTSSLTIVRKRDVWCTSCI